LTKPLCTTLSILSLIEKKELDWGYCIKDLINVKTSSVLKNISVGQLLSHSSGLIDYRPFFKGFEPVPSKRTKKKIIEAVFNEPLAHTPGKKCMYSDLGYILLGEIIEKVSGKSIDKYFKKEIIRPLQLEESIFFKSLWGSREKKITDIAATERCSWRKKLLQGEVHDEHSWLMGGIAGHAGLFGTAGGVLTLLENILHLWQGREEHPAYSSMLLQKAIGWKKENETWAMGFDRPSTSSSSAGKYFSPSSIGHLGYTGTSFWIDPEKELIIVLLTNRIHPTRKNEKIKQFRPVFHNTVVEALGIK
jgi:CubicO group peptidase (beta-lactamase class C family)